MFAVPPPSSSSLAASPRRRPRPAAASSSSPNTITELDNEDAPVPVRSSDKKRQSLLEYLASNPTALLTDHERCFDLVATAVLLAETLLSAAIVRYVPYTEIDFSTYLQQAQAFMDGERDYALLKGESGPANYPALHIYLYSALSWLTDRSKHLERAQWAFAGIYLATMAVVLFGIYRRNKKIPPWVLPLLCISKRLHSIYMLRMFNDCVVMLFVYCALALYMVPASTTLESERAKRQVERRWLFGTVLLSCALSIKMSTLLFLPALFYLTFVHFSPLAFAQHLVVLLSTQVLLSYPFLHTSSNRLAYLSQAFDFGRVFEWEFTVNWRWVGQEAFEDPNWGRRLMVVHQVGLMIWGLKWAEEDGDRAGARMVVNPLRPTERLARGKALTSPRIATIFFCANLTGIVCARSLHPQFYAWFAHQLVWLCFGTGCPFEPMHCLVLISLVEYGFSVWPSTVNSSLGLVLSLVIILFGVYYGSSGETLPEREDEVVVPAEWDRVDTPALRKTQ
ncbi:hypothetical protein JCM8115_001280 [Rhodotorula mucilaginosa]